MRNSPSSSIACFSRGLPSCRRTSASMRASKFVEGMARDRSGHRRPQRRRGSRPVRRRRMPAPSYAARQPSRAGDGLQDRSAPDDASRRSRSGDGQRAMPVGPHPFARAPHRVRLASEVAGSVHRRVGSGSRRRMSWKARRRQSRCSDRDRALSWRVERGWRSRGRQARRPDGPRPRRSKSALPPNAAARSRLCIIDADGTGVAFEATFLPANRIRRSLGSPGLTRVAVTGAPVYCWRISGSGRISSGLMRYVSS